MLKDYLNISLINSSLSAASKDGALKEMAALIINNYKEIGNANALAAALSERERIGSTAIENGIAVPHAKVSNIKSIIIAVGRSEQGIDFNSNDGKKTHLFFILLAPENAAGEHIKVLARLAKLLSAKGLKEKLLGAKNAEGIYQTLVASDGRID